MTTLPVSERFFAVGITDLYWLPTVAGAFPTRAEIAAGTKLQPEVVDLSGWEATPNSFAVNTLGSRVSPSLAGRQTMGNASLTFAADRGGDDIRSVLEVNDKGFILWADGGDVPTYPGELFPSEVSSITVPRSLTEQEARVMVSFSLTNVPRKGVMPAAA